MKRMILLLAGSAIAGLWGYGGTPWGLGAAVLVAVSWGMAESRRDAFLAMALYYLLAGRGLFHGGGVFFAGVDSGASRSLGWGAFIWIAPSLVLASVWALCWGRRRLSLRTVMALLLVSLPPVGLIGWASPIAGVGVLFPALGWVGLVLTVVAFVALAVGSRMFSSFARLLARGRLAVASLAGCAVVSVTANIIASPAPMPAGWVGVDTHVGRSDGYEALVSLQDLTFKVARKGAQVIVLPEAVGGPWDINKNYWLPYQDLLRKHDVTVLVGAEQSLDGRRRVNALFSIGRDQDLTLAERVPVPLGMWRPWASDRHIVADWGGSGIASVRGRRVAYLVCYEQLLVWPVVVSLLHDPDVLIGASNVWWAQGTSIPAIQRATFASWGRLFSLPVVDATNE
ncbi:nitrilase-related carbon-nitrogen hydrolase [Trinickia mobilis]|uniref:nitrilase-related carbon-nitrogen hydrolase n=1 Tax=Trinickia mobilis TaxID=2816356 RepID=UPI001A8DFDD7|nr:nitrilase-related carbon-nitrogen hydrolase [Trinickia mobilis]